jgi:hypothetical protein
MGPLAMQHGGSRVVAPPDGEEAPHQALQEEVPRSCEVNFLFCFVFDGLLWFLFLWFVFLYGLLCPCFLDGGHTSFLCSRNSISCLLPASRLWLGQCVKKNALNDFILGCGCLALCFLPNASVVGESGRRGVCAHGSTFTKGGFAFSSLSSRRGGSVIPGCLINCSSYFGVLIFVCIGVMGLAVEDFEQFPCVGALGFWCRSADVLSS